ncbi:hypothetical protein HDU96_008641 [Phlyctochytrium bullatum]|nr:hypothetical protein HDU96_008641 [Phlyctochytrium bullatum]
MDGNLPMEGGESEAHERELARSFSMVGGRARGAPGRRASGTDSPMSIQMMGTGSSMQLSSLDSAMSVADAHYHPHSGHIPPHPDWIRLMGMPPNHFLPSPSTSEPILHILSSTSITPGPGPQMHNSNGQVGNNLQRDPSLNALDPVGLPLHALGPRGGSQSGIPAASMPAVVSAGISPIASSSTPNPDAGATPSQQASKRARVTQACDRCQKRKYRCDGARPVCGTCQKRMSTAAASGQHDPPETICNYTPRPPRLLRSRPPPGKRALKAELLKHRISQLEERARHFNVDFSDVEARYGQLEAAEWPPSVLASAAAGNGMLDGWSVADMMEVGDGASNTNHHDSTDDAAGSTMLFSPETDILTGGVADITVASPGPGQTPTPPQTMLQNANSFNTTPFHPNKHPHPLPQDFISKTSPCCTCPDCVRRDPQLLHRHPDAPQLQREDVVELVRLWFRTVYWVEPLPILHPPTFLHRLARGTGSADKASEWPAAPSTLLVHIMCATAAVYSTNPAVRELALWRGEEEPNPLPLLPPPPHVGPLAGIATHSTHPGSALDADPQRLGEPFFAAARALLMSEIERSPDLESVQAMVLMAHFAFMTGRLQLARTYVSMAIDMAHALHLHAVREEDEAGLGMVEREERRRAYWACYFQDRVISATMNRDFLIPEFIPSPTSLPLPLPDPVWRALPVISRVAPPARTGSTSSGASSTSSSGPGPSDEPTPSTSCGDPVPLGVSAAGLECPLAVEMELPESGDPVCALMTLLGIFSKIVSFNRGAGRVDVAEDRTPSPGSHANRSTGSADHLHEERESAMRGKLDAELSAWLDAMPHQFTQLTTRDLFKMPGYHRRRGSGLLPGGEEAGCVLPVMLHLLFNVCRILVHKKAVLEELRGDRLGSHTSTLSAVRICQHAAISNARLALDLTTLSTDPTTTRIRLPPLSSFLPYLFFHTAAVHALLSPLPHLSPREWTPERRRAEADATLRTLVHLGARCRAANPFAVTLARIQDEVRARGAGVGPVQVRRHSDGEVLRVLRSPRKGSGPPSAPALSVATVTLGRAAGDGDVTAFRPPPHPGSVAAQSSSLWSMISPTTPPTASPEPLVGGSPTLPPPVPAPTAAPLASLGRSSSAGPDASQLEEEHDRFLRVIYSLSPTLASVASVMREVASSMRSQLAAAAAAGAATPPSVLAVGDRAGNAAAYALWVALEEAFPVDAAVDMHGPFLPVERWGQPP